MKTCTKCKQQVPDSYKLCPQCGIDSLVVHITDGKVSKQNNPNHNDPQAKYIQASNNNQDKSKQVKRAKRIPMLKPWAVVVLLIICLSSSLLLFKAGDGIANWMVENTSVSEEEAIATQAMYEMDILSYSHGDESEKAIKVDTIGQTLIEHISPQSVYDYEFYIIKEDEVNAFALPSGKVFVFDGLYKHLNDDELAGVLAHEIMHAEHRHGMKGYYKDMSLGAVLMWIFGVNDVGADVIHQISSLHYSRELETEADVDGVKLMISAGYDPQGMVTLLSRLDNLDGVGGAGDTPPEWLSDHPHGKNRAQRVAEEIGEN